METLQINANTKIGKLIKNNPEAMEAIISIDSKFKKLKNPILRKVFANRTSIAMAAKIAGCKAEDFFKKLEPLGFIVDRSIEAVDVEKKESQIPDYIRQLPEEDILVLDVRPDIDAGKDPLKIIMNKVKEVKPQQALRLINSFEPIPLILMLEKQGFSSFIKTINSDLVETYFYKSGESKAIDNIDDKITADGWEDWIKRFKDKLIEIDVRPLPMPQPMHTILGELDKMGDDQALFVNHKRIPVFLLPELDEMGYTYRIKKISDGEVRLLIFKKPD